MTSASDDHFDALETRDPEARETAIFNLVPDVIRRAKELAPGWSRHLADVDPVAVTDRTQLAQLPLLRKSALKDLQNAEPPFGGFTTKPAGDMGRIFLSPGPIFEPEGLTGDYWRSARALYAAGFRKGDVVHNTFAYHLTPGGWILDAGARALGCAILAAGPGNTEQQLEAISHLKPSGFVGVPDYLKILLDKADEAGQPITSYRRALVSGGALFPSLRQEYQDRGIQVLQAYATADVGVIAYESSAVDGMIIDEGVIVEIVRPGTGDPVPDGEVGEVVVTALNRDYPMFRLATGDLSAVLAGQSPCGRTNMRIKGWMGRADQTTKVKGMFVHPEHIADVAKRHPELGRVRLVVSRDGDQDLMTLKAEAETNADGLADRVASALQDLTKLKGVVEIVAMGSLPNDGKVIEDARTYDS
ncbi:MAG: AMP-binding protein [Pseudomonadota bacterium]